MHHKPVVAKKPEIPVSALWFKIATIITGTLLCLHVTAIIVWVSEDRTYVTSSLLIQTMMTVTTFCWAVLLASRIWDWLTDTGVNETPSWREEEVTMFECRQTQEPESKPEIFITAVIIILLSAAGLIEPALAILPLFIGFITFSAFAFLVYLEWDTRTKRIKSITTT